MDTFTGVEEPNNKPLHTAASYPRLSVCMIVRDEADCLARCLRSVMDVAHEVIVVDTGSTDGTPEIARNFGASVHHFDWCNDFAAARNASLEKAVGDWVLIIDADETLDAESIPALRRLMNGPKVVYSLKVISRVSPGHSLAHYRQRLFPNRERLSFSGIIREQLVGTHGPVEASPAEGILIHHEGCRPEVCNRKNKPQRDLELLSEALRREPENPVHHHNLGVHFQAHGLFNEAVHELLKVRRQVECAGGKHPWYFVPSLTVLAVAFAALGRHTEALDAARQATSLEPGHPDAHFEAANALLNLGRFSEAAAEYRQVLASSHAAAGAHLWDFDPDLVGWKGLGSLGIAYYRMGEHPLALETLDKANVIFPGHPVVVLHIALSYRSLHRLQDAVDFLHAAPPETLEEPQLKVLATLLSVEHGGFPKQLTPEVGETLRMLHYSFDAADAMAKESPLSSDDERVSEFRVRALQGLGDPQAAGELLVELFSLEPKNPRWIKELARLFFASGEYDRCIECGTLAIELGVNDDPQFFAELGDALQAVGRFSDSENAYNVSLELAPDSSRALKGLASLLRHKVSVKQPETDAK